MRAMKAMRLTAMLAISDIDWEAPLEAASMIFLSWLKKSIQLTVWLIISFICYQRHICFLNAVYNRMMIEGSTINFVMRIFLNICIKIFNGGEFVLNKKSTVVLPGCQIVHFFSGPRLPGLRVK